MNRFVNLFYLMEMMPRDELESFHAIIIHMWKVSQEPEKVEAIR